MFPTVSIFFLSLRVIWDFLVWIGLPEDPYSVIFSKGHTRSFPRGENYNLNVGFHKEMPALS